MVFDKRQLTTKDEELKVRRHSATHVMAEVIQSIFPEAKFGIGPVIESGFYYERLPDIWRSLMNFCDFPISPPEVGKNSLVESG